MQFTAMLMVLIAGIVLGLATSGLLKRCSASVSNHVATMNANWLHIAILIVGIATLVVTIQH